LLTRKKVNSSLVKTAVLKAYKRILEFTSGHLENHDPSGIIKTTRGTKFKNVISKLFPGTRQRGIETALKHQHSQLYRNFEKASSKNKKPSVIKDWLLKQDAETLH
jgi:hypothetical protein